MAGTPASTLIAEHDKCVLELAQVKGATGKLAQAQDVAGRAHQQQREQASRLAKLRKKLADTTAKLERHEGRRLAFRKRDVPEL